eukprot:3166861-Rhodomonas_salina.1
MMMVIMMMMMMMMMLLMMMMMMIVMVVMIHIAQRQRSCPTRKKCPMCAKSADLYGNGCVPRLERGLTWALAGGERSAQAAPLSRRPQHHQVRASIYGGSAAIYGGSASIYGGSAAIYGGSAAVCGGVSLRGIVQLVRGARLT